MHYSNDYLFWAMVNDGILEFSPEMLEQWKNYLEQLKECEPS